MLNITGVEIQIFESNVEKIFNLLSTDGWCTFF